MHAGTFLLWALAVAAPDPSIRKGEPVWFALTETREEIARLLGPPVAAAPFGSDFVSWQYRIGEGDHHDHTHLLVFRRSTGVLVSVTRVYEPERAVDEYFPAGKSAVYEYAPPGGAPYPVRLRRLSGGRLLLAMGSARAGAPTGQLVLMHESVMRHFHPWLADRLGLAQ